MANKPKKNVKEKLPKAPAYLVGKELSNAYPFKAGDLIQTPVGLSAIVLGVRYKDTDGSSQPHLWVQYANLQAPLALPPHLSIDQAEEMGYKRCSAAELLRSQLADYKKKILVAGPASITET